MRYYSLFPRNPFPIGERGKFNEEKRESFLTHQDNTSFIFNKNKDFDSNNKTARFSQADMRPDFMTHVG